MAVNTKVNLALLRSKWICAITYH